MEEWKVALITAVASVLASTGFWTYLQKRMDKKSLSNKMLLGLGHDRIMELGMKYIDRGYVTNDEYENLYEYLYVPYKAMGGNGTAERMMQAVKRLEVRDEVPPTWPDVDRRKNGGPIIRCEGRCQNSPINAEQKGV